ncbi:hypothetical protein [Nonomuraea sp. NPDC023979]|uniref:hypothetical protein n=1 Tax=Nonomuraea sp. NPDC023979 TaxID=3154796 RepID=UPI0034042200
MARFRSEFYTTAQLARRVRVSESRARAWYSDGKLPPPDGRDADKRPLWAATTIDAWCRRTGRVPADDALWLWRPEAEASRPAPVLFHGITEIKQEGKRYGVHAVLWDTPHGHVVALTPLADEPAPDIDRQPLAAATLIAPVFWPDAIVALQLGAEYGADDEIQMQVFSLEPAHDRNAAAPHEETRNALLGGRSEHPSLDAATLVQPTARFHGMVTAEDLARVIGAPVPVWPSGTCTASAIRRAQAARPAAHTLIVPSTADGWQAEQDQLEAAVKHGLAEEFPAAFTVLATDLRDTLERARRERADRPARGTGWYLAAQPALPELPWSAEQFLRTAGQLSLKQAADDFRRLRSIEPDLPASAAEGAIYERAMLLLRARLRVALPELAVDDVEYYAGEWDGPIVELWRQSMTSVDGAAAVLTATRRGKRLADHGDLDHLVGLWRDTAGRYVAVFDTDLVGNPPSFIAEWPYAPPAGWTEQTVIAADENTGAVLAITPQESGEQRIEPVPFDPGTGPSFRHGYGGGSPYTLYQALIRAVHGTITAPFNLNDIPFTGHEQHDAPQRSMLWHAIATTKGPLRLPWPQVQQWARQDAVKAGYQAQ